MQSKRSAAVVFVAMIAAGSAMSLAAQEAPGQAPGASPDTEQAPRDRGMTGQGMMGNGMMGQDGMGGMMGQDGGMGGMMGMMNMMNQCSRMMNSGMGGGMTRGVPQLPPGNEKLQVQMHAEIMRTVGEILAKYAGRVKN
jgi:hypothetical protein